MCVCTYWVLSALSTAQRSDNPYFVGQVSECDGEDHVPPVRTSREPAFKFAPPRPLTHESKQQLLGNRAPAGALRRRYIYTHNLQPQPQPFAAALVRPVGQTRGPAAFEFLRAGGHGATRPTFQARHRNCADSAAFDQRRRRMRNSSRLGSTFPVSAGDSRKKHEIQALIVMKQLAKRRSRARPATRPTSTTWSKVVDGQRTPGTRRTPTR